MIAIFCPIGTLNVYVFEAHSRDLWSFHTSWDLSSVLMQFGITNYRIEQYVLLKELI